MEEEKNDKLLTIYFDRKTEEYDSFNVITLTDKLTRERLEELAQNWNNNPNNKTTVKIYDDKLLIALCDDVYYTKRFNAFIEDMRDLYENMHDISRSLSYEAEELQDYLKENYPTEEEQA